MPLKIKVSSGKKKKFNLQIATAMQDIIDKDTKLKEILTNLYYNALIKVTIENNTKNCGKEYK